jgi:hypothetical protein
MNLAMSGSMTDLFSSGEVKEKKFNNEKHFKNDKSKGFLANKNVLSCSNNGTQSMDERELSSSFPPIGGMGGGMVLVSESFDDREMLSNIGSRISNFGSRYLRPTRNISGN